MQELFEETEKRNKMYNLHFLSGNKVVFSKSVNIDKDVNLHIALNRFIDDNINEIDQSMDDSDNSQYTRQFIQKDEMIPFIVNLSENTPIRYGLDDNGLLYSRITTTDEGFLTINKIEKIQKLNLVKWNNVDIEFRIGYGLGAAGLEGIYNEIINILVSQPVDAILAAYDLLSIASDVHQRIKGKLNKKDLKVLARNWVSRGIYPPQLKAIILTNRWWNKNELQKLLGVDERVALAIMYSLGYIKIDRSTFERAETEEAKKARDLWDQAIDL